MEEKITLKFEMGYASDYALRPAHGLWVSKNPMGDFSLNFYTETSSPPKSVTNEILNDGKLGPEIERDINKSVVTRTFVCGVLVNQSTLKAISDFMNMVCSDEQPR